MLWKLDTFLKTWIKRIEDILGHKISKYQMQCRRIGVRSQKADHRVLKAYRSGRDNIRIVRNTLI